MRRAFCSARSAWRKKLALILQGAIDGTPDDVEVIGVSSGEVERFVPVVLRFPQGNRTVVQHDDVPIRRQWHEIALCRILMAHVEHPRQHEWANIAFRGGRRGDKRPVAIQIVSLVCSVNLLGSFSGCNAIVA